MATRELTGRKVFLITASAFGIIIGVNLTMAFQAVRTFPGLEVKNSYVASQSFDERRAAQEALGWTAQADLTENGVRIAILDHEGKPVQPESIDATIGRPTHVADDILPTWRWIGDAYEADMELAKGLWTVRVTATDSHGTLFDRRMTLRVR